MTDGQWILEELCKGRILTNRDIMVERGCMNGKARIAELRQEGHPITTTMVTGRRKSGDKCRYASYKLEE